MSHFITGGSLLAQLVDAPQSPKPEAVQSAREPPPADPLVANDLRRGADGRIWADAGGELWESGSGSGFRSGSRFRQSARGTGSCFLQMFMHSDKALGLNHPRTRSRSWRADYLPRTVGALPGRPSGRGSSTTSRACCAR